MLLLLLLLLPAGTQEQSGDREPDMEPRIRCSSHISTSRCSLTCELPGGGSDDEDAEEDEDGIESMSVCYTDWLHQDPLWCLQEPGNTISSEHLKPLMELNLTVYLRRGLNQSITVRPMDIVKPRTPQVWNVTFDQDLNQAVIHFRTPDNKDYLRVDNQEFQLHIQTVDSTMIQKVSSKDFLLIDMDHLRKHTKYHVKVRAIPRTFKGSWSKWSETFSFFTPAGKKKEFSVSPEKKLPDQTYIRIMCLVSVLVVTSSAVICWKNKIFSYMWPSIPHPKQTLVQICKPNKGLLLNFKPEVFSTLKVYPLEKPACEEMEPSIGPAAADSVQPSSPSSSHSSSQSSSQSSTHSSGCRSSASVSTEELELLLSSSSGEDSLQSSSPSLVPQPMETPGSAPPDRISAGHEVEMFAVSQQEEAYVTMSSFYQIK
uniref:Interleukin 7 receptor n=1 Tax=Acanthochromis polyacanthus TaxID=80966 RepID=A0A3Q1F0E3_9TELE